MNLYFVYANGLHYTEPIDHEIGGPSYNDGCVADYVYAENPGKAKSKSLKANQHKYPYLEYTDLIVSLKRKRTGNDTPHIASPYEDDLVARIVGLPDA